MSWLIINLIFESPLQSLQLFTKNVFNYIWMIDYDNKLLSYKLNSPDGSKCAAANCFKVPVVSRNNKCPYFHATSIEIRFHIGRHYASLLTVYI